MCDDLASKQFAEIIDEFGPARPGSVYLQLIERGFRKGFKKGFQEELEKGKREGKIETAKKMLQKGYSLEQISELTELSIKELEKMKAELSD